MNFVDNHTQCIKTHIKMIEYLKNVISHHLKQSKNDNYHIKIRTKKTEYTLFVPKVKTITIICFII